MCVVWAGRLRGGVGWLVGSGRSGATRRWQQCLMPTKALAFWDVMADSLFRKTQRGAHRLTLKRVRRGNFIFGVDLVLCSWV